MNYCLGKLPARADARRLMMATYTSATLPPPPATCDRTYGITNWGALGNDRIGDCAYAGAGHAIMAWSMGTRKKPQAVSDADIIKAYSVGTGYNPATGANNNGANLVNVQEQWRSVGIGGNKILAYAGVDLSDPVHIRQAIYYFGGCYVGIQLPQSAIQQTEANLVWNPGWFSPTLGGHCIHLLSYTAEYVWAITWGKIQCMTWDFLIRQCDEAYAIVDPLWVDEHDMSPVGLNLPALLAAQKAVNTPATLPPLQSVA